MSYRIYLCLANGKMGPKFGRFGSKAAARDHLRKIGWNVLYHEIRPESEPIDVERV